MAETITSVLDLIKPEIGGSKTIWGNRWNDNAEKLDKAYAADHDALLSSIQNGGNLNTITRFDASGNAITPPDNLADEKFRVMQALLLYNEALYDDPMHDIPVNRPGAVVSQKWVKALLDIVFPIGIIVPWGGLEDQIPRHWLLCNGQSFVVGADTRYTPNLLKKFIMGAGTSSGAVAPVSPFRPGDQGGVTTHVHHFRTDKHILTRAELPAFRPDWPSTAIPRGLVRWTDGSTNHGFVLNGAAGGVGEFWGESAMNYLGSGLGHDHDGITDGPGTYGAGPPPTSTPIDVYPPYWALCYIMKAKNLVDDDAAMYP